MRRPALAAAALAAVLAVTATACGSGADPGGQSAASGGAGGESDLALPDDLNSRLKELGLDLDQWRNGDWKNWEKDDWLREANDFINPVIDNLWKPERMRDADVPEKTVPSDVADDQGVSDPVPNPVQASPVDTPYHSNAAPVGKVFFDGPEGSMVCSGTVVKDPANPGKSNLVWTAGHCVHAGKRGGWYRNIVFVPSYNDNAVAAEQIANTPREQIAPYGIWWSDRAATSDEWIAQGAQEGGAGAPYDYAVLRVKPEEGSGATSLEETVGTALPVAFDAPAAPDLENTGAWGYPAAPPFDGVRMFSCVDRAGRLSLFAGQPTMYRIGCTMTGGSSGGGWFSVVGGETSLVSNTSIGPATGGWLAGPRLAEGAKAVFDSVGGG
ncbi:hypothetical protein HCK00_15735 [Streptomyces sp. PLAI1-29]|uniref:Secreted protein n=1 Tax=Streptomyces zingiberis TaxID=2053010 RepID=A0ABX1C2T1_9ACTN|nr:hypothetical protein [Streptomyces zingiberis]